MQSDCFIEHHQQSLIQTWFLICFLIDARMLTLVSLVHSTLLSISFAVVVTYCHLPFLLLRRVISWTRAQAHIWLIEQCERTDSLIAAAALWKLGAKRYKDIFFAVFYTTRGWCFCLCTYSRVSVSVSIAISPAGNALCAMHLKGGVREQFFLLLLFDRRFPRKFRSDARWDFFVEHKLMTRDTNL